MTPTVPSSPGSFPLVQRILPFALSIASGMLVAVTLSYTDQRFTLIVLTLMLIAFVSVFSYVAHWLGLYVSEFLIESFLFLLGLMVPTYLFQFFQIGLSASPSPEWFEAVAYIVVLVVILLLVVAMFFSKALRSLTAAIGDNKPQVPARRPKEEKTRE